MSTEQPYMRLATLRESHSKAVLAKAHDLAGSLLILRLHPSLDMGPDGSACSAASNFCTHLALQLREPQQRIPFRRRLSGRPFHFVRVLSVFFKNERHRWEPTLSLALKTRDRMMSVNR